MTQHEEERLWERIFSRENLIAALRRVKSNGGAPGVDGMMVEELPEHLKAHWPIIRAKLEAGIYQPSSVKRVEIPKSGGGVRRLGIPTVLDRLIQQSMHQVLSPLFEETYSDHSYGFRPGRSAHDAVRAAQKHVEPGHQWVVDVDLERFFDSVNHDRLMARMKAVVKDKRVLRLVNAYLKGGHGQRGSDRDGGRDTARWAAHPTNNIAKNMVDFSIVIPPEQLRPKYGDGFKGAPLGRSRSSNGPADQNRGVNRDESRTAKRAEVDRASEV